MLTSCLYTNETNWLIKNIDNDMELLSSAVDEWGFVLAPGVNDWRDGERI